MSGSYLRASGGVDVVLGVPEVQPVLRDVHLGATITVPLDGSGGHHPNRDRTSLGQSSTVKRAVANLGPLAFGAPADETEHDNARHTGDATGRGMYLRAPRPANLRSKEAADVNEKADYGTVCGLLDDEIRRVSRDDLEAAPWWEYRRRHWLRGVRDARAVSERQLRQIRDAISLLIADELTREAEDLGL